MNLNRILSYSTLKVVTIRDWKLGALHYIFMLCILGYIVGFTLIYQKRYQAIEAPVGSVRLSFLSPEARLPPSYRKMPSKYDYCLTAEHPFITIGNRSFDNYNCSYWDESLVVYPPIGGNDILVTTRYTESYQKLDNCSLSLPNCTYIDDTKNSFYIAGISEFTYMVQHSMFTSHFQKTNLEIEGSWKNKKGKVSDFEKPNSIGRIGKQDIFTLDFLLRNTGNGVDLDTPSHVKGENRTLRAGGIVILLYIHYTNRDTYNQNTIRYTYEPHLIPDTYFKSEQPIYTKNIANRKLWDRHGVRLVVIQTGQIAYFDFQTLLLTMVSGLGLLAVSTTIVDVLAVHVMPKHEVFHKYKYEGTPAFKGRGYVNSDMFSDPEDDEDP